MNNKLPDPMLQHCKTCKHHPDTGGGWCYMFREKPLYLCCKPIYEPKSQETAYSDGSETPPLTQLP